MTYERGDTTVQQLVTDWMYIAFFNIIFVGGLLWAISWINFEQSVWQMTPSLDLPVIGMLVFSGIMFVTRWQRRRQFTSSGSHVGSFLLGFIEIFVINAISLMFFILLAESLGPILLGRLTGN